MNSSPRLSAIAPNWPACAFRATPAYKFADAEKDLSRPTVSLIAVGGFLPFINAPEPPVRCRPNTKGLAPTSAFPYSTDICSRPAAKLPCSAPWNPTSACATSSSASPATCAWPGPAPTTLSSASTSRRSFCARPRSLWILRKAATTLGLSSIVELTQAQLNLTEAEIENLNAKYDYQTQYRRCNTPSARYARSDWKPCARNRTCSSTKNSVFH